MPAFITIACPTRTYAIIFGSYKYEIGAQFQLSIKKFYNLEAWSQG